MLEAADEVCGWTKGACRHGETWWWEDSVKKAVDAKRKTLKEWRMDQQKKRRQTNMQRRNVRRRR